MKFSNRVQFKAILTRMTVYLLVIGLPFFVRAADIPENWESYFDRPDILNIKAAPHDLGEAWQQLKAAHFSFVAELFALYPTDTHFYFLARDSEYLYDVARLVTQNKSAAEKIHLLNVSTENMNDKNLKSFLRENGISASTIDEGRKVLFVDTGFSGSIPKAIGMHFTQYQRSFLKTHLIVSHNTNIPSSMGFLYHLNPLINQVPSEKMDQSIISYEYLPRFTDRSSQFFYNDGRYHPISHIGKNTDGPVSKTESQFYQEDLKSEWLKPETQKQFYKDFTGALNVKNMIEKNKTEKLLQMLVNPGDDGETQKVEAWIRDVLDSKSNTGVKTYITLMDLELTELLNKVYHPSKSEIMKKNPVLAPLLMDPDTKIPQLFTSRNWPVIKKLIDLNMEDYTFYVQFFRSLFASSNLGVQKSLQIDAIEKGEVNFLRILASYVFSQPHAKDQKEFIRLSIKTADKIKDRTTLILMAVHVFSKEHSKDMKDLVKLMVEVGDKDVLNRLEEKVFSQPHAKAWPEYQILVDSLKISDSFQRKQWLDKELLKMGSSMVTFSTKPGPVLKCSGMFLN